MSGEVDRPDVSGLIEVSDKADVSASRAEEAPLRASIAVPVALAAIILTVHIAVESYAPLIARVLGASIGICAVGVGWRYLHLQLFHRLPLPEWALLQAYVVWGVPTVTNSLRRGIPVTTSAVTVAVFACVVFLAAALVACPVGLRVGVWLRPRAAAWLPRGLPDGGWTFIALWLALALVVHSGAVRLLPTALRYPVSILASFYGLLIYFAERRDTGTGPGRSRNVVLVAWAFAVAGMLTGMLVAVVLPLAATALLVFMRTRRLPWRWAFAAVLLFAVLNPAKHVFRQAQDWQEMDKTREAKGIGNLVTGPIEAAEDWWKGIQTAWAQGDTQQNTRQTIDRFNDLSSIARTIEYAGKRVPYDRGRQWRLMPYSFVPRILYPDKPDFTVEFNDRYNWMFGIKPERTMRNSTFSFPIISDGYWNYGWLGVVIVGFIVGIYWGLVSALWMAGHWGLRWLGLALFATYFVTPHLYSQIGGLPQTVVGIGLVAWTLTFSARLLRGRGRSRAYSEALD